MGILKLIWEFLFGKKEYPNAEKKGEEYAKKNDDSTNHLLNDVLAKLRRGK